MFAHRNDVRRAVAGSLTVLLLMQTTGCATWTAAAAPTPEALQKDPGARIRITTKSHDIIYLERVRYQNDSIVGIPTGVDNPHVMGVPLSSVVSMEKQGANAVATVVLTAAMIGVVAAVITGAGSGSSGGTGKYLGGSSCPLIYSWDGTGWRLDSGTFGGAIAPALGRTDLDNLLYAHPEAGLLKFRMTDEAEETEHVDAFTVLAVDHPAGTDVAPDARANNTFHVIGKLNAPKAARDLMGRDVLAMVKAPDAHTWESVPEGRDAQNPAHLRDGLELTFSRPSTSDRLQLVIDAQNTHWANTMMQAMVSAYGSLTAKWYDTATSAAASAPMARAQHAEGFLQVAVWDGSSWRPSGEIWEAGPEVAKRQVLPIDVRGIPGNTIRVRLESAPSFWQIDYVGLGPIVEVPVIARDLPTIAVTAPRVTDALERLSAKDNRFLDMERNDTVWVTVRETAGAPARGMVRSYLARTSGWYRIHGRDDAAPDMATLMSLADGPHAPARLAVIRMNASLAIVNARSAHALPR